MRCRDCAHGQLIYAKGYPVIMCKARLKGLTPYWYIEGKSAPMQTPIFDIVHNPDCKTWQEKHAGRGRS